MSGFLGRARELETLAEQASRTGGAFVPIWGRRRVGKSELILRFARGRPTLYLVGKTAPAALHIAELTQEAARVIGEPLLAELPKTDWKRALGEIALRWRGPGKLVIALDEFQWLAASSPELPSVLQELWDRSWRDEGRIMLILCGSLVGFMEREVLGKRSPLFGRRTAQIHLAPFGYREAAEFFPTWSRVEQARAYFVCGGVPTYLKAFDPHRSVEQNIAATLLDPHGVLHSEPNFLLREELREIESYYGALMAVAEGRATPGEIARRAGLPERSLHYYLQQLVDLGYVGRRYPITGKKPAARHVRFRLEDPLLRFWFRFVFPSLSRIERSTPREAMREVVRPELDGYFGDCFERLCREALVRLYAREGVAGRWQIGEYWDKQVQIDVVGHRDDGWTDLGECKWGSVRSESALRAELEAKVLAYPTTPRRTIQRRLFVREKPAGRTSLGRTSLGRTKLGRDGVHWHDLDDLYR